MNDMTFSKILATGFLAILSSQIPTVCFAQDHSVYLIGDTGEENLAVIKLLANELKNNQRETVVFLGDNIYPGGLVKGKNDSVMTDQLEVFKDISFNGRLLFVPGNHDWRNSKFNGLKRIKDQKQLIDQYVTNEMETLNESELGGQAHFPGGGTPGPVVIPINSTLDLYLIDTQWFLESKMFTSVGKAIGENGEKLSRKKTKEKFWGDLESRLQQSDANNKKVLIAAHHPLQSIGGHGKKKTGFKILLQTVGQVFSTIILRQKTPYQLFSQDIQHSRYSKFKKKFMKTLDDNYLKSGNSQVIYTAGHEHNLQFWKDNNRNAQYIVSGSGSKTTHYYKELVDLYEQSDDVTLDYPKKEIFKGLDEVGSNMGFFRLDINEEKIDINACELRSDNTLSCFPLN